MVVDQVAKPEAVGRLGSGSPEKEYDQTLQFIRYFLEYRTKVFGFCVTVNGAALAIGQRDGGNIWLWGFSLAVTIVCLLAELRSIDLADQYRAIAKRLEATLGFSVVTEVDTYAEDHGVSLRLAFRLLYGLFSLVWAGRLLEKAVAVLG